MAESDWEELVYSFAEYIPEYGMIYSFRRSHWGYQARDDHMFWASAVNLVAGVARDVTLIFEATEPLAVVVIHAVAESTSDKWTELMARDRNIITNYRLQGQPNRDGDHTHVLITSKSQKDSERAVKLLQHQKGPFLPALRLHKAIYLGKFNFEQYAKNENFWLVFPTGLHDGGHCYALSTFSKDSAGISNRPVTSLYPKINIIDPANSLKFRLKSDGSSDEYYWFEGVISSQGKYIQLEMYARGGQKCTTIQLTRQVKSRP